MQVLCGPRAGAVEAVAKAWEVSPTAEYPPIIGPFENSKDGAELPGLAALGEYIAPAAEFAKPEKKPKAPKDH